MLPEVEILVDIEHDGPIPGDFSMIELGAVVIWQPESPPFSVVIKPLHDGYDPSAQKFLDGIGLTRKYVRRHGTDPFEAMKRFDDWIRNVAPPNKSKLIFVHFGGKDWNFVDWYFWHFLGRNPFERNVCEMKAFARGFFRCGWEETKKPNLPKQWRSALPHTHRGLDDAMEHADQYRKMWTIPPS